MRYDLPGYSSSVGKLRVHVGIKAKYCHKIFLNAAVGQHCEAVFREVFAERAMAVDEIQIRDKHKC